MMNLKALQAPDFVVAKIAAPLPDYVIQEREAGKGQTLSYISGATVIDILNTTFGHLGWNFEILKEWKEDSIKFFNKWAKEKTATHNGAQGAWEDQAPVAWVHGRLTVFMLRDDGTYHKVVKEAFGSKSIIGKQSEQEHIFKSAQTDALKKAASLLGIGAELYRGEEESMYYDVISKPIVWTKELIETSKDWATLMGITKEYGWDINDINYYVNELTEGGYIDLYTLPEVYLPNLIDHIKGLEQE